MGLEPRVITSIDLRLSGGKCEKLPEDLTFEKEFRIEAAREELINPLINLRQQEFSYKGDIDRVRKTFQLTTVLILILALIFGITTTLKFLSLRRENVSLQKHIYSIYHNAFPQDRKIIDPARQFKGNLNTLIRKGAVLGGIPALDILHNIANLKDDNITLYEFNVNEKIYL